jgi:hypothetical protein
LVCMCLFWNKCMQSFVPILFHFLLLFFKKKNKEKKNLKLSN